MSACSSPKPILYPNYRMRQLGEYEAENQMNRCIAEVDHTLRFRGEVGRSIASRLDYEAGDREQVRRAKIEDCLRARQLETIGWTQ